MCVPRFDREGLVPVVVQDMDSGAVLMLAYANQQALDHTRASGRAHFYSRSRGELWDKGKSSGQVLSVVRILEDCDQDAVLYQVQAPKGACHTGDFSCFGDSDPLPAELGRLWATLSQRISDADADASYTRRLYASGLDRVLRKIGEEAGEVIIACKGGHPTEVAEEASDLVYHLWVALLAAGVPLTDVAAVLNRRAGRQWLPSGRSLRADP